MVYLPTCDMYTIHVVKYTSPMDGMGYERWQNIFPGKLTNLRISWQCFQGVYNRGAKKKVPLQGINSVHRCLRVPNWKAPRLEGVWYLVLYIFSPVLTGSSNTCHRFFGLKKHVWWQKNCACKDIRQGHGLEQGGQLPGGGGKKSRLLVSMFVSSRVWFPEK